MTISARHAPGSHIQLPKHVSNTRLEKDATLRGQKGTMLITNLSPTTSPTRFPTPYPTIPPTLPPTPSPTPSPTNTQKIFYFTGRVQNYSVPMHLTFVTITAKGAKGGSASYPGGYGGYGGTIVCTVHVTPNQTLFI